MAPIKGPDLLLSAFERCSAQRPDWDLVLAGPDDGMLAELRARVATLGLNNRVHFVGFLDETAKSDALAASDLVVVPSRREAMSIVVLEAAVAGRPVLITDQCGVPDVADSGGGGVVEPTADALAAGLLEATRDRAALASRGEMWRQEAVRKYAWSRVAQLYIDVFSVIVKKRRGRDSR